ncbi:MAG TPA: ATP-binding protein [Gemmatimonadales bacterium]|jgi:signal transduction histidine kinase|nr:ATP-binding protein [Gemmatimonadales bacterium]
MTPLDRLRLRLTLWYAGVLTLIVVLLGGGTFAAIRHQMSRQLDASLKAATAAVMQATLIREVERTRAPAGVADAVAELRIPDRSLYLFDSVGQAIVPAHADGWIANAARQAARDGSADVDRDAPGEPEFRLHAERFSGGTGITYVAASVADRMELEETYGSLIVTFGAAALAALLLVAGGGYVLIRQSTAPVERSMEQMRRFMADAAHELRTPITLLRTRTEVALAQPRDAAGDAAAFHAIEREADRLGGIIGDLLLLARADAGERQVVRESLYLDDVASQAVAAVRTLAERKGVTLIVGSFEEAQILGDAELVERLLLIVLDNAIKYTPEGGQVRLDVTARDGNRSVIVSDSGVGIPAAEMPRIFERFYRGDSARSRGEGAGLGLPIARWIADLHEARMSVSSDSEGTRVQIDFPPGVVSIL